MQIIDIEAILDDWTPPQKKKFYSITFGNSFIVSDSFELKGNADYVHEHEDYDYEDWREVAQ